jgi:type II pantothenate kinase
MQQQQPLDEEAQRQQLQLAPAVCATGGGAFKYEKLFREALHIRLHKEDELRALVKGIDFCIHTFANEVYTLSSFHFRAPIRTEHYPSARIHYPYLVCNIGSGVSILKVSGPASFERVGGSSLGGGTFYGLCRALTGCSSFEEALALAERGRGGGADLLVGDIYGGPYTDLGLPASTVAASFGKLVRGDALQSVSKADLAKAALVMITNNIGSLANLYAHKVAHAPQIVFVGNFLHQNDIARRGLAFATDYWSKGQSKALFLTHEGYFGAVGAMLGGSK